MAMASGDFSPQGGEFDFPRPRFHIGQHDPSREEPLTDLQYGQILNTGVTFVTTPVTNRNFHARVIQLTKDHLAKLKEADDPQALADPIVPPLTPADTALFPSYVVNTYTAYTSPWIDLASTNPAVASISRQVLNLEVAYANFCGVRSVVIPGPRIDASKHGGTQGLAQYGRAIQEALTVGLRLTFILHFPMNREDGLEERVDTLSSLAGDDFAKLVEASEAENDLYSAWASWHLVRTVCNYNLRLYVAVKVPAVLPEREVQEKWFAEPLHYLTLGPQAFQKNSSGYPALPRSHQELLFSYMTLKNAPWLLLSDVGPDPAALATEAELQVAASTGQPDFPSLQEAATSTAAKSQILTKPFRDYIAYLKWLELQQPPLLHAEQATLTNFQDWLQSPLQPLSDNLESATYEVFEGDPVKYNQYEAAIAKALAEWKDLGRPYSSTDGSVVIAVAGSGRGPLVTRALKASAETGVPIKVWAVEKNPNAYVYLLHQNQTIWDGKVTVVKTDMRSWKGPLVSGTADDAAATYGKVDILISELLGSFGDNELSPECLDGVQHVLAPHGISIPESYTAHMTPIATPRIHAELLSRAPLDPNAFETPWVVRLFAIDFAAAERVPGLPRFQQAWEFKHPIPDATMKAMETRRAGGIMGGGGGSMAGAAGANDHNSRFCHLTFVCRTRGVIHGLAGYFESVLYAPRTGEGEKVEISTHPDFIDQKSRDMISWFPIFFPIKQPLYYPADTELEVTMWRQTDDTKVWYEWLIEAYTWVSETQRIKVASSEFCSSRKIACVM